jgi:hypothetical protein
MHGYNISNPSEAETVVKIAQYLKKIKNINLRSQVCILTFYNGQVYCIKQAILKCNDIKNDGLRVMTVDSFQGRLGIYIYIFIYIYIYVYKQIYNIFTYLYMCVYMNKFVYAYIYIY